MRFSFAADPIILERRHGRLRSSLALGAILWGPLGVAARATDISAVPFTITAPGSYTMTMDLNWPGGGANAITILASNVVLDLGGHTLSGNTAVYGIRLTGVSAVTVMNGVVSGFLVGVHLDPGSSGNTLTGLTASFNQSAGIDLDGASGNTIENNTLVQNTFNGIGLSNSSQNLLQGNTCTNQLGDGIQLISSSNDNTLLGNTCNGNFTAGIRLASSDGSDLQNNTTNNNGDGAGGGYGIHLQGANGHFLLKNTANNNARGIGVDDCNANTLLKNTTNANLLGIDVRGAADGNVIRLNRADANTSVGINMETSGGNLVTKNTALNSGIYDLQDANCINTWKNNVFVISCAGPNGCSGVCID